MTQTLPVSDRALYARLLGYLKPYRLAFALSVLCIIGTAATEPVFPAIMKYLLDHGFQTANQQLVWLIPLGIVGLFALRGMLSFVTNYLMTWVSTHLVSDLRRALFAKILVLPTQTFHDQSSGKLIARLLYDVDNVSQAATGVLVTATRESLTAVALLAYLLYLDWKLTLITLAVGPLIAITVKSFSRRMRATSRNSFESMRTISHTIEETVAAHKVIKIYGSQEQLTERFFADIERFRRSLMREAVPASAITPITHLAASLAIALITYLSLNQSLGQASSSAGGFVSFITAMLLLISPMKQLTTIAPLIQRGLSACESVFGLLDSPAEHDPGQRALPQSHGEIEFVNVSFGYPDAERLALSDISFSICTGQTVALVGASGGGKSTIGALICRFYEPTTGCIRVDGVDIHDLSLLNLRSHIALVSQDIVLLDGSVADNITFGQQRHCSRDEVIQAAQAANAWDFIQQLPQGLDTLVGQNGTKLSGGQRQRLAIARALLKNAPILILDEATSALDTESERQVQLALATLMKNRTTLVIAHRLSTIERADQILVLERGRIVESGTHASLTEAKGYYANLQRSQT
jgi:subfamily B ATP-binding cassette protein MsbA